MKNATDDAATPATDQLSFEQWLTNLDDSQLRALLAIRRDCALPIPPGFAELAARLRLPLAVRRATDRLGSLELAAAEAAAAVGAETDPITADEVVAEIRGRLEAYATPESEIPSRQEIIDALSTLLDAGLIYGDVTTHFQVLPEVMNEIPAHSLTLPEPPSAGPAITHEQTLELLPTLSAQERKILDTLARSGGTGLSKDAAPDADPSRPVAMLIRKGLLTRIDDNTVQLRKNTRSALLRPASAPTPLVAKTRLPDTPATAEEKTRIDQAAVAAGLETCRNVRRLLEELGAHPASCLKDNSIGVRAVSKLAKSLELEPSAVVFLVCLAEAAELVDTGEPEPLPSNDNLGNYLAPTALADDWLASEPSQQWAVLLEAWRTSPWQYWTVGGKDERDKPIQLLSEASSSHSTAGLRALIMRAYTRLPEGVAVPPGNLLTDLGHLTPAHSASLTEDLLRAFRGEAELIGAIAHDAATSPLRALQSREIDLEETTRELTPTLGTTLIAQADMTILAPGPLTAAVQEQLETLAEMESLGLASVYRVTEASIRKALDTGRSGAEIVQFLEQHALGEVPQSISYLIADVARRHGTLRGGPAMSYLRSDDPALLAHLSQHPVAMKLAMRLIAPTVAVSQAPLVEVLEALRAAGFQPVAEDATGASIDMRPLPSRVPHRPRRRPTEDTIDAGLIQAVVSELRRNDVATKAATRGTAATDATGQTLHGREALSVLQAAARGRKTVTLGFVDKHGTQVHRVVRPLTVAGGQVDALDAATGKVHRFQLHRITEVILD